MLIIISYVNFALFCLLSVKLNDGRVSRQKLKHSLIAINLYSYPTCYLREALKSFLREFPSTFYIPNFQFILAEVKTLSSSSLMAGPRSDLPSVSDSQSIAVASKFFIPTAIVSYFTPFSQRSFDRPTFLRPSGCEFRFSFGDKSQKITQAL